MNLPRSTFYYHPVSSEVGPTDAEVIALIEGIQDEFPRYGYRRVTHELRRRGLLVNHKKVARIMRLGGLGIRPRRRFVRTTDSRHDLFTGSATRLYQLKLSPRIAGGPNS